jgi:hypothetical protein
MGHHRRGLLAPRLLVLRIIGGDAHGGQPVQPRPVRPWQAHHHAGDRHGHCDHGLAEIEDTHVTDRQDEVEYQLADLLTLAVHVLDRQCLLQPGGHLRVLRRVGGRELLPANGILRAEQVKHRATLGREGVRLTRTHSER